MQHFQEPEGEPASSAALSRTPADREGDLGEKNVILLTDVVTQLWHWLSGQTPMGTPNPSLI